jgi:hypothetical protein
MKIREYIKRVGDSCVTDSQKVSFYQWVGRLHTQGIISDYMILQLKKNNNDD